MFSAQVDEVAADARCSVATSRLRTDPGDGHPPGPGTDDAHAESMAVTTATQGDRSCAAAGGVAGSESQLDAEAWQPVRSFLSAFNVAHRSLTLVSGGLASLLAAPRRILAEALNDEWAVQSKEAGLRAILGTAPEAIVVIGEENAVEAVNPAAETLFGYSAEEVVGKNVGLLILAPNGAAPAGSTHAPHDWTGGQPIAGLEAEVMQGQRRDGSVFPLELALSEFTAEGCASCLVAFIRDVTAHETMEQELRQAQKMGAVGQLTGGVAHDFNNLLTVALGNIEMLQERLADEPDLTLLREAGDAIHSGAELTSRLLAVARDDPPTPRPLELRHEMNGMAALLQRTLGVTFELRVAVPEGLPAVLADPGQLRNAVLNLAINARDAMPEGGRLGIEAAAVELDADYAAAHAEMRAGHYVMVAFSDEGSGMSPEVRERAFEPFFTTKPAGAGTGLGLSMVHDFLKQSGGHVELRSNPGQGTTVRLYLPQAEQPARDASPSLVDPSAAYPGRGETVLVVDDDPRVRRVSAARLKQLGYHVLQAEDGPRALQCLAEAPRVDLLFSDMVMPGGMTGRDLAEHVMGQRPELRVVLTSGTADLEPLRHSMPDGVGWLPKPYTALDLARTLRQVLDGPRHPPPASMRTSSP